MGCRWPFVVGFATTGYIFAKIAGSVTGAQPHLNLFCHSHRLGYPLVLTLAAVARTADEDVKASKFANPSESPFAMQLPLRSPAAAPVFCLPSHTNTCVFVHLHLQSTEMMQLQLPLAGVTHQQRQSELTACSNAAAWR
jgi:hypothetical protein